MKTIYNAFVVMHIRMHDARIGKFKLEVIVTLLLILLLLLSLWRLLTNFGVDFITLEISFASYFFRIVKSFIILFLLTVASFFWLTSWPKSARAINDAGRGGGASGMQDATFKQDRMQDTSMKKDLETKKREAKEYTSPFDTTNKYYERLDNATSKFESNDGSYMTFDKEIQEKREAMRKKILGKSDNDK